MEFQRLILIFALFVVGFILWSTWEREHVVVPVTPVSAVQANNAPTATVVPETAVTKESLPAQSAPASITTNVEVGKPLTGERYVSVKTDTLNIVIDTHGGNIVKASLPKYPEKINEPNVPIDLLSNNPQTFYVAESALIGSVGPDSLQKPATYTTKQHEYTLAPGQNQLAVVLNWQQDGISVDKVYTFKRNNYLIDMAYRVNNNSGKEWNGKLYTQILRKDIPDTSSGLGSFFSIHPYVGAAISTPEKNYEEVSLTDLKSQNLDRSAPNGWVAMVQHYFLSAWIPKTAQDYHYYSQVNDNDIYTIGIRSGAVAVGSGAAATIGSQLYIGPEITDVLKSIAPGLDLTVSYGWLWFISAILLWVMKQIYTVVGNWGWSIVLVTLLIKLMFYHLSAKSYKSMAKMRQLQPKIEALRERIGDDKQKMGQAMMELYKEEKVNPLGGCLPVVVQIPVFFALYMVLISSVELRQAPWILWIHDLSAPDPYYILPLIMGVTMFIQQRLSPPPADPTQAKVMMFLPVIFTFVFIQFPAGLVLYWSVNNILSILQQWYITYKFEHAKKGRLTKVNAT